MPETAAAASGAVHLNILLLAGLAIAGGTLGAGLFKRLRIPQVVGYIAIGFLVGRSVLNIIDHETLKSLQHFNFFALGLIGFEIGGSIKIDLFRKHGRQLVAILLGQGLCAAILVGGLTFGIALLAGVDLMTAAVTGLILGAIASATAPAATVHVLHEYRARGVLTTMTLAVIALDDALAVALFAVASSVAAAILGKGMTFSEIAIGPLREIGLAAAIGGVFGVTLGGFLRKVTEKETELVIVVGTVLLAIGASLWLHADPIITAMVLGFTLANIAPAPAAEAFGLVNRFATPVFVLFFVMAGSRLELKGIQGWMWLVAGAYVLGRVGGKVLGAMAGASLSGAARILRRNLGLCLASQAGVAVGLAILAGMRLGEDVGDTVVAVVTTTVVVFEIAGPLLVKYAVVRSGEAGRDVTEEDLILARTVGDAMDASPPTFHENTHLTDIIHAFSHHDVNAFPVLDDAERLKGLITINEIREGLATEGLGQWLLAVDMMGPVRFSLNPDAPLGRGLEAMRKAGVEVAPVVFREDEERLAGMIDRGAVRRALTNELLRRQAGGGQDG
ncbi:MAG: cation:proton antiporter domain-containing protein [Planctomycetota bacterium]|jgi:Kef-type K+ transport system membrane component KefB